MFWTRAARMSPAVPLPRIDDARRFVQVRVEAEAAQLVDEVVAHPSMLGGPDRVRFGGELLDLPLRSLGGELPRRGVGRHRRGRYLVPDGEHRDHKQHEEPDPPRESRRQPRVGVGGLRFVGDDRAPVTF